MMEASSKMADAMADAARGLALLRSTNTALTNCPFLISSNSFAATSVEHKCGKCETPIDQEAEKCTLECKFDQKRTSEVGNH